MEITKILLDSWHWVGLIALCFIAFAYIAYQLTRWLRRRKKERYHAAWLTERVSVNGSDYTIRELAMAERLAFQDYINDVEHQPLLAYAWLISTACFEWEREDKVELAAGFSPTALAELGNKILELSGMMIEETAQTESAVIVEDEVKPGTVEAAKKNSDDAEI